MPVYCCVSGCGTNSKRNRGLTFHGFPKQTTLRQQWTRTLRHLKPVTNHSKVCSLHFQDDIDFTTPRKSNSITRHRFLKEGASPSNNLPTSLHPLPSPEAFLDQVPDPSKSTLSGVLTSLQSVTRKFDTFDSMHEEAIVETDVSITMPNTTLKLKPLFGVDLMTEDQLVHYTGFSRDQLERLWTLLVMRKDCDPYKECTLSSQDQLLLTLIKLRMNISFVTLRITFGMTPHWASRVFRFWLHKMYLLFKEMCFNCPPTNFEDVRRQARNNFAITSDLCEDHPQREEILSVVSCLHYFCGKKLYKNVTVHLNTL